MDAVKEAADPGDPPLRFSFSRADAGSVGSPMRQSHTGVL
jgi:hypothetical protein